MRFNYATQVIGATCFSISALIAADNKSPAFRPKPAEERSNVQKTGGLLLAAEPFSSESQTKLAFGKLNPNQYGVLPVLLVVSNGSGKTLQLEKMRVELMTQDRKVIEATPAAEVRFLNPVEAPKVGQTNPIPKVIRGSKKNPLAAEEIEGRAFVARVLPAGEKAHGFFYFQVRPGAAAVLNVSGIKDSATGAGLFFVDIPLDGAR